MFERANTKSFNVIGSQRSGHHFLSHILIAAFKDVWYCNNVQCSEKTIKSANRKLERRRYSSVQDVWVGDLMEEQSYDYVFSTHPYGVGPASLHANPVFLLGEHINVRGYRNIQANIKEQSLPSTTLLSLRSPKNCFASWLKLVAVHPTSRHENKDFDIEARSIDFVNLLREHNLSILEERVDFIPVFYDELISNERYYDSLVNLAVEPDESVLRECRKVKNKRDNTAWKNERTSTHHLNRASAKEIIEHPIFKNRIKELNEVNQIHNELRDKILN